jgi:hypothetical protein
MKQPGTWIPYEGGSALILALVLLVIAAVLTYFGIRLRQQIEVKRPGKFTAVTIILVSLLSGLSFLMAGVTYVQALKEQVGPFTVPKNPISPITGLSALITFVAIAYLTRHGGFKKALGSAIVGTIAAPFIFELPFDLIVFGRTYPPTPEIQYSLLYFLPLFALEISSYSMLAMSPFMKLSRYTLFSLAGMFLVFAVWTLVGFSYPSSPVPIALNAISKVLSFVAAITLFLPEGRSPVPNQENISLEPSVDG